MSTQISVRFDDKDAKRLAKLSKAAKRPIAYMLRQLTLDHLEDMEDIYISMRRIECGERNYSWDELMEEMETWPENPEKTS